jgi:hypothetical protein
MRIIALQMRRLGDIIPAKGAEIMSRYIHELTDWPNFSFDEAERLPAVSRKQGRLLGRMESLCFVLNQGAGLHNQ